MGHLTNLDTAVLLLQVLCVYSKTSEIQTPLSTEQYLYMYISIPIQIHCVILYVGQFTLTYPTSATIYLRESSELHIAVSHNMYTVGSCYTYFTESCSTFSGLTS